MKSYGLRTRKNFRPPDFPLVVCVISPNQNRNGFRPLGIEEFAVKLGGIRRLEKFIFFQPVRHGQKQIHLFRTA